MLVAAIALAGSSASAHVTLENRQAAIGSAYKAVFVVPHGCSGSATVELRVQIPPGVIATEAKATPGWEVATVTGKYTGEYEFRARRSPRELRKSTGAVVNCRIRPVRLLWIDTFLTNDLKPNTTLYFPSFRSANRE
jgi:periplasmic copper chaperone A